MAPGAVTEGHRAVPHAAPLFESPLCASPGRSTSGIASLLDISYTDLLQLLDGWREPRYRGAQIWRWIYRDLVDDPCEMANLPKDLRRRLSEETCTRPLETVARTVAGDGLAEKVLFRLADGNSVESVLMRYNNRYTVCASSQIGCPIGCPFCATGKGGFVRDLAAGEIVAQILHFAQELRQENARVTNVVFMGMGEPMLNFDAVWQAVLNLNHDEGLALGARRFTLSTAGVIPGIQRMARKSLAAGLAISLHAPDDALRDRLVPVNRRYPLDALMQASREYVKLTRRKVTFEYALIRGVNDTDEHARRTADLLRGLLCGVNLISLNPTPGCDYKSSPRERVLRFREVLLKGHIKATVRLRRGTDIEAGCGQLRAKHLATQA